MGCNTLGNNRLPPGLTFFFRWKKKKLKLICWTKYLTVRRKSCIFGTFRRRWTQDEKSVKTFFFLHTFWFWFCWRTTNWVTATLFYRWVQLIKSWTQISNAVKNIYFPMTQVTFLEFPHWDLSKSKEIKQSSNALKSYWNQILFL